jgi:Holliday junction resolvase RusA-like endonuclease
MIHTIKLKGVLIGLNEYVTAERSNKYKASEIKRQTEHFIACEIRKQLKNKKVKTPVFIKYTWIEKNKKRDKDNIAFAKKFIQDAMVKSGIIENDGWGEIAGFEDNFKVDKENAGVIIEIIEVEEQ